MSARMWAAVALCWIAGWIAGATEDGALYVFSCAVFCAGALLAGGGNGR